MRNRLAYIVVVEVVVEQMMVFVMVAVTAVITI